MGHEPTRETIDVGPFPRSFDGDRGLMAEAGFEIAEKVYRTILAIKPGAPEYVFRLRNRALLAELRDFIAASNGQWAQTIEDAYEAEAEAG